MGCVTQLLPHLFLPLHQHTDGNLVPMKKGKAPGRKMTGTAVGSPYGPLRPQWAAARQPRPNPLAEEPHLRASVGPSLKKAGEGYTP